MQPAPTRPVSLAIEAAPIAWSVAVAEAYGERWWEAGGGVRRWQWHLADEAGLADSALAGAFSPLLARALWARGRRSPDECQAWLAPRRQALGEWQALPDLPRAVALLAAAVAEQRPIALFGDYDVDGVTATAIVALALRAAGVEALWRLPDRLREGYGLSAAAVAELAAACAARGGRGLLLTIDCGTGNRAEIAAAAAAGLDVVVLDHHALTPEPPPALALVNPRRLPPAHPSADLTAAGLALRLVEGLLAGGLPLAPGVDVTALKRELIGLAALGTVADVAPLIGDNRALVARGLRALQQRQRPGLAALLEVAGLAPAGLDAIGISWRLAPRLNAAGRMEHPALAMRLLLTEEPAEAAALAAHLEALNGQRQQALERLLDEARAVAGVSRRRIPVLAGDGWSPGLVGLVAGRLAEELGRPVIVLGADGALARGSARSIEAFDITGALDQCRPLLVRHGGHRQAAGLTVARDRLAELEAELDTIAAAAWPDGPPPPRLVLDGAAHLAELQPAAVADLERLAPFGRGNEEPLWLVAGVRVLEARRVGGEGRHLQLRVAADGAIGDCIAFGMGARQAELAAAATVDLAGVARLDHWRGARRVKLHIRDLRPVG